MTTLQVIVCKPFPGGSVSLKGMSEGLLRTDYDLGIYGRYEVRHAQARDTQEALIKNE